MRFSIALIVGVILFGATTAAGVAGPIAPIRDDWRTNWQAPFQHFIRPADPMSFNSPCPYWGLTYGPVVELAPSSQVSLIRNETLLVIDDEDSHEVYDLSKSPFGQQDAGADKPDDAPLAIPLAIDDKPTPIFVSKSAGTAEGARGPAQRFWVLNSGRAVSIRRFYGNVFILIVWPSDWEQYDQLASDLLNETYCGVPFERLSPKQKQSIRPIAKYFLWSSLSSGILDSYAPWIRYKKIAETFLSKEELGDLLEDYAYRAAEIARADPTLSKIDPDKVWSFAWNAVAELVHDKEFVKFSDLSSYQRDGRIAFMLLGSEPISGGRPNKFGFYTKTLTEVGAASLQAPRDFSWNWDQDEARYTSSVVLRPVENQLFPAQTAFPPDERNGLVVLDATFAPEDIDGVVNEYMSAFRSEGFVFAEQRPVADLPRYIQQRFLALPRIDYLVREGHSDGDDDNVMTVYEKGFVIDGQKTEGNIVERISILVGDSVNSKEKRIPEYQFTALVNEWHRQARKPFVYLNTSCWGLEKAWMDLSYLSPESFIEIASRAPVNYFSASHADPVRIILDGIRRSDSFDAVRSKLSSIESYASGFEDRFIFPDEKAYPKPFARLHRSLFVRKTGERTRPYIPDGYF